MISFLKQTNNTGNVFFIYFKFGVLPSLKNFLDVNFNWQCHMIDGTYPEI